MVDFFREAEKPLTVQRRSFSALGLIGAPLLSLFAEPANAFLPARQGYRAFSDKINGFYFYFPETWIVVSVAAHTHNLI